MKGLSPIITPEPASSTSKSLVCDLCQSMIGAHHWDSHIRGEKHRSRETFTKYRNALEVAESDKHDVVVSGVFDFDFVAPSPAALGVQNVASITTSSPFSKCVLKEVKLASAQGTRTIVTRCVSAPFSHYKLLR
jgi:helicase MOV-10